MIFSKKIKSLSNYAKGPGFLGFKLVGATGFEPAAF